MIVPGSHSQALGAALAAETGRPLAAVGFERFPDGERMTSVRIHDDVDRAVVVAATHSDGAHVELLQLQDAVREAGVDEVTTVLPYMGYGRQERAFEPGQPVSARAVARAVSTGTDRVVLVDPHEASVTDFFDVPCEVVGAASRLAAPLPGDLTDPLFLAPDEGALDLATAVRDAHGRGEVDYFEKVRRSGSEVEVTPSDAAVEDRDVVAVDDIVATGSTMSESIAVLDDRGAADVVVVGEAPAAGDPDDPEWPGGNRSGLAYTSRHSGRRIRSLLASVGLEGGAFYTNAVKCFPAAETGCATDDGSTSADSREPTNREPTASERANCRSHLRAEVEAVEPTVVLPTGRHATESLLAVEGRDLEGFLECVLDPIDCPTLGVTAIPLLHPSYADVWRARLGHDRASYREALAAALRADGVDARPPGRP